MIWAIYALYEQVSKHTMSTGPIQLLHKNHVPYFSLEDVNIPSNALRGRKDHNLLNLKIIIIACS